MNGIPIPANQKVNVYWGAIGSGIGIHIATCQMNDAMRCAREWFQENDHYFNLENFPPYYRMWGTEKILRIDYGSYANYIYCIPVK